MKHIWFGGACNRFGSIRREERGMAYHKGVEPLMEGFDVLLRRAPRTHEAHALTTRLLWQQVRVRHMGEGFGCQEYRGPKQLRFGQVLGVPYLRSVPPAPRLSQQPAPSPRHRDWPFHWFRLGLSIFGFGIKSVELRVECVFLLKGQSESYFPSQGLLRPGMVWSGLNKTYFFWKAIIY